MVDRPVIDDLVEWITDGARPLSDGRKIVAAVCERLNEAGVPVDLYRLFLFTIHPTIKGRRLQWSADKGTIITEADFALFETEEFSSNPLPVVARTGKAIRRRLIDPDCPHDYKVIDELIADGFTDYLVQPVIYVDGDVHTMSWSSRHPGGFSPDAVEALERIRAPLTRLVESYILRLNAVNIISTYVGRNAGEKVLGGKIRRGDAEEIAAVILFADVRDFTDLSNRQPVGQVLETLNRFFDAIEAPVIEGDGEILKFIGDEILAIFPIHERDGEQGLVRAARAASDAVATARTTLAETGAPVGFRSAIHFGRLFYGNMGASRRLDFTAIGPAVNLTARLLSAASSLGHADVCSADIASLLDGDYREAATIPLKGFDGKQTIYARML